MAVTKIQNEKAILTSERIDIKHNPKFGSHALHFIFKGKFTEEASKISSEAWRDEFNNNFQINDYAIIWDCLQMNGFEIGARKEWYSTLSSFSKRIRKVYVVSDSILIRGAARVMLNFFGMKSEIVSSYDQIRSY
jgi:hypothetical protein